MSARRRWRGLGTLVRDAVEHGSRAVERLQKETAARPFALLALVPGAAPVVRVVQAVHDASVSGAHGAIRLVNRAVGAAVEAALEDDPAGEADDGRDARRLRKSSPPVASQRNPSPSCGERTSGDARDPCRREP